MHRGHLLNGSCILIVCELSVSSNDTEKNLAGTTSFGVSIDSNLAQAEHRFIVTDIFG